MRHPMMAAVVLGLLAGARPASAHAFLKSANPAVGSTIRQSPSQLEIIFTEGVEPAFSTIAVTNAAGARIDTGAAHLEGDDTHMAVALPPLAPGVYTVAWHALSTDTHKTQGSFSFTLRP